MHNDSRKDAAYFKAYIDCQHKRIQKYTDKLAQSTNENNAQDIHGYLAHLKRDLFYAEYSYGLSRDALKQRFEDYLADIKHSDDLTYSEMEFILALYIVFEINDISWLESKRYATDDFVIALLLYIKTGQVKPKTPYTLNFPETTEMFWLFLTKQLSIQGFGRYLSNQWYEDNTESGWYGTHKNKHDTYVGYYSFVAAAVVKALSLDKTPFESIEYFPDKVL